jgi:hypothetical protein
MLALRVELRIATLLVWRLTNLAIRALLFFTCIHVYSSAASQILRFFLEADYLPGFMYYFNLVFLKHDYYKYSV